MSKGSTAPQTGEEAYQSSLPISHISLFHQSHSDSSTQDHHICLLLIIPDGFWLVAANPSSREYVHRLSKRILRAAGDSCPFVPSVLQLLKGVPGPSPCPLYPVWLLVVGRSGAKPVPRAGAVTASSGLLSFPGWGSLLLNLLSNLLATMPSLMACRDFSGLSFNTFCLYSFGRKHFSGQG